MGKPLKQIPAFESESEERAFRVAANKRDVPYQSLIKMWLAEKIDAS